MDYDPLPMSIYDKGSKHGKGKGKSQGLALSHLFSPLGAVTMLFALAVWAVVVVYWQKLGVAKQLKESQRELSGSNQMHRMLDTQHQAAMDELKSHKANHGAGTEEQKTMRYRVMELEQEVKRLTKVETGLNHQLRTDKESKLHLMQVHEEDVARLEVKNKETQELHEKLQQQHAGAAPAADDNEARILKAHLQERTETLAAEKTDLQRQLAASQAELAACFDTLTEATITPAHDLHHDNSMSAATHDHEPPHDAPKPEVDDAVELSRHAHSEHVDVQRVVDAHHPEAHLEPAAEDEVHVPEPHYDPQDADQPPLHAAHEVAETHASAAAEKAAAASAAEEEAAYKAEEAAYKALEVKERRPHKMNAFDTALGTPKHHEETR